jgi:hypothetical protein
VTRALRPAEAQLAQRADDPDSIDGSADTRVPQAWCKGRHPITDRPCAAQALPGEELCQFHLDWEKPLPPPSEADIRWAKNLHDRVRDRVRDRST